MKYNTRQELHGFRIGIAVGIAIATIVLAAAFAYKFYDVAYCVMR